MTTRRSVVAQAGGLLLSAALGPLARAQQFPDRPIKIIVPFPPGGPADTAVRAVQQGMEQALGRPLIVENLPGAAGAIGLTRLQQAAPDGYTLLEAASPHVANAAVRPASNIDILRDFAPVGLTSNSCYALVANPTMNARSLQDVIALAKSKPGELKIGSVGNGSAHHLIAEMLKSAAGIDLLHVPYRGEAPALVDLVAGRIDLMFMVTATPYVEGGQVVGLGVTSAEPWFSMPQLKPLQELGLPGFVVYGWNGLMVPKSTPPAIIGRLSDALAAALKSEAAVRALRGIGVNPGGGTPELMAEQIRRDTDLFRAIIRERQLKFDN
jgi:tripartite-type tricarboxylate transporter receptor subunit TctC